MKKKIVLILGLATIIAIISTICFATNEPIITEDMLRNVEVQNEIMTIEENEINFEGTPIIEMDGIVQAEQNENIINYDVYKAEENINESNKIVDGNQFLIGNNIKINSETINGDLFITGTNVEISSDTTIDGNLFICAETVNLSGIVNKSAFLAVKTFNMKETSSIGYTLNLIAEKVQIDGIIKRSANMTGEDIKVGENAIIIGSLNYSSDKEAEIKGNIIGDTNFSKTSSERKTSDIIYDYVMSLLRTVIFTLVTFIIILKLIPKFILEENKVKTSNVFKYIGVGLLSLILIPVLIIIGLILDVTAPIGLILIPIFIILLCIANTISVLKISSYLSHKITKIKLPLLVVLTTIIVWALEQIPVIGVILTALMILTGIGIVVLRLFKKNKEVKS